MSSSSNESFQFSAYSSSFTQTPLQATDTPITSAQSATSDLLPPAAPRTPIVRRFRYDYDFNHL